MKKMLKWFIYPLFVVIGILFLVWVSFLFLDQSILNNSVAMRKYNGQYQFDYEYGIKKFELSIEEALEDLDWFRLLAIESHPKLAEKASREQFENECTKIVLEIEGYFKKNSFLPVEVFSMFFSKLAASIEDAHTFVRYTNGIKEDEDIERLPFDFKFLSDGVVVSFVHKKLLDNPTVIKQGMQLTSVNGVSIEDLQLIAKPYLSAENDQWRRYLMSYNLPFKYFINYLTEKNSDTVHLGFIDDSGKPITVIHPYVIRKRHDFFIENGNWFDYEILKDEDAAIFRLEKCFYTDEYISAVDDFFAAIKINKISKIIIDLRENTGGSSMVVNPFLSYMGLNKVNNISAEVYQSAISLRMRRITSLNQFLRSIGKFFLFGNLYPGKPHTPENIFDGEIYILISGKTFSSGNLFALYFSDNHLGTLVGESTGNAPSAYGDILPFTLKNSGIPFTISYKKFTRADISKDPADELIPDIIIPYTVSDFQNGKDPQLEYILNQQKNLSYN